MTYLTPTQFGQAQFVEKRSRFIGQVWPVASEDAARGLIAATKAKYHDARHNCWCYCIRDGGVIRYADDGEPQGTAGQPILEVFRCGGINNVLCIVTRYFGGILLGAGGLTRAYAHTAKIALDAAGVSKMQLWTQLEIVSPYSLFDRIKNEIELFGGLMDDVKFEADVTITALFPEQQAAMFSSRLRDVSAAAVSGVVTGEKYIPVPIT